MRNISKEKPFKGIIMFAIPLIVANLLAQSYNIIDLVVAGNAIGSHALSATGCTSTLIQFLSSLFWGFGVAVSTGVGELYGEGKNIEITKLIKTVLIFIFGIELILCGACVLFSKNILTMLKVDEDIFEDANLYFMVYMISLFIQSITYQIISLLHGVGDSKFTLVMNTVSGLMNLGLNIFFVLVIKMGVLGLAIASIISSLASMLLGLFKSFKIIKGLGGDLKVDFNVKHLSIISRLAIPCILQQCALYLSSVIVQPYINNMGDEYSAGYSVAMNVNLIFNAFYHGISRSVATYCSQSKGGKKFDNFTKGIVNGVLIQIILVTPIMLLAFLFPEPIFGIFVKNGDKSCLPPAISFTKYCIPFLYFICFGNLMHSFYKSVEATKTVVVSTTLFTICRIGLTYVLKENGELSSVYLALSFSWVFEAVFMFVIYLTGIWKSKEQKMFEINQKACKSC